MKPPFPKVPPIPCPEAHCGGKMTLGHVPRAWSERQREAGRIPPVFAYFCSNRRHGCLSLLMANDDGSPRGVPLTKEIRDLRKECHDAFDRIWRSAGSVQKFSRPMERAGKNTPASDHRRAILTKMRRIAYFYLAHLMKVPEPEVHVSQMSSQKELLRFKELARRTTAQDVIDWWESEGAGLYGSAYSAVVKAARHARRNKEGRP